MGSKNPVLYDLNKFSHSLTHGAGSVGHNWADYNPTGAWELWKQSFLAVAKLHAPVKKRRVRNSNSNAPWLTPEIKRLMWERDRIKRIAIVTSDQLKWAEYRRLRNRVNHSIKASKKNYFADRRAMQLKSLMFKTVNNLVPEYLSDKFASINTIHRHNLRGAQHNLFIPRPNTEALKKRFRYRGAVTWNSLSAEAKQATTLNYFYSAIVYYDFLSRHLL